MNTWLRMVLLVMMILLGIIDLAASTPDPIFVVGNEKVNAKEVILPHTFTNSPGVTLYQTLTDGYNLRLNGAIIEDGGIQSTVPFTIELLGLGENVITISGAGKVTLPFGGIDRSAIGIYACRGVKIIGPGSLTILNTANIAAASRTARSPVGIRVGKYGNFSGGGLTINRGASVSVKTHYGDGIVVDGGGDVDIGSSAVSTYSGTGNGIVAVRDYATLGGTIGKIKITASMLVDSSSRGLFASDAVEINAACCTLVNEHYSACANANFHADQSVVNAYSATEDVIIGGKKIFLGEGVYNLAAGTKSRSAIHGDNVVIDGADITCCVPGGFGVWYVDDCVMRGGTLKFVSSMDVRGCFAAGSLASIAVGTADSWRSIENGEAFYAAAFSGALDLVGSLFVHNPSGAPLCGVYSYYNNGAGRLAISGGTSDTTQAGPFGFCVKSAEISGGSVHGEFVHEVV